MAQAATFRRRQNRSCDQCRAGKRRCDVQLGVQNLKEAEPFDFPQGEDHEMPNLFVFSPCSNCKKWKKRCTIDWVRSHQPRQVTASTQKRRPKGASISPERMDIGDTYNGDWHMNPAHGDVESMTGVDLNPPVSNIPCQDNSYIDSMQGTFFTNSAGLQQHELAFQEVAPVFQPSFDFLPLQPQEPIGSDDNPDDREIQGIQPGSHASSNYSRENSGLSVETVSSPRSRTRSSSRELAYDERLYFHPSFGNGTKTKPVSPFSSHFLTEDHNRLYIKKGLLKIYHDSLEGALSCWLIERNCPYASSPSIDDMDTWSSNWSNRIIARVRALDDTYAKLGLLSKDEQKQASNVLSVVVMAFAVQWAQTAFAKHENLRAQLPEHGIFGRNMQKQLWHKANMALSQATSNPSFKVIFAGIVFSLVQRPMDSAEVLPTPDASSHGDLTSLRKILNADSGPIFLDVAVRKLHDHQRRLKDFEHDRRRDFRKSQSTSILGDQDKQTFSLMFWLAIMFDTLSAAMNRRSFVLTDGETKIDEDEVVSPSARGTLDLNSINCDLDGYSTLPSTNSPGIDGKSQIWGNYFLQQQSRIGDMRKHTTRWPCSYMDAASCLADAAPVKVLVFRRLGHLQDLYYQHAPTEVIENAIASTVEVYNHWKSTYGLFIADCIANHENLPPRIQSWYILLASHWHLAILLFSDLVEKLDDLSMTSPANRSTRQATEFAATLRTRSVCVVSDLGRCSRSSEDLSFTQSPDFHHAVNKAALLTEPWTVVLVRSFAYAGEVLAKLVLSDQKAGLLTEAINLTEARSRLHDCIEALWLLSRKSDMALCAAKILQEAVYQGVA